MSIKKKPLKDIFKSIREEIIRKLETSEDLKEVQSIIYGERERIGSLRSPSIWIVPNPYQPNLRGGHTVEHEIPFDFVALVKSHNTQEGLQKAQELALTVYDILLSDRTLEGIVSDVRPLRIDPAFERGQSNQIYWSAIQLGFKLQRRE